MQLIKRSKNFGTGETARRTQDTFQLNENKVHDKKARAFRNCLLR